MTTVHIAASTAYDVEIGSGLLARAGEAIAARIAPCRAAIITDDTVDGLYGAAVETSLREVNHGVIEAAQSMGASTWQIVTKVMLPEATPSLISGGTITLGTILGYGAMAGIIGGGGLGKMAINYGYYNFKFIVMWAAVIGLILLVQIFQSAGTRIAVSCDKRLKNRS